MSRCSELDTFFWYQKDLGFHPRSMSDEKRIDISQILPEIFTAYDYSFITSNSKFSAQSS